MDWGWQEMAEAKILPRREVIVGATAAVGRSNSGRLPPLAGNPDEASGRRHLTPARIHLLRLPGFWRISGRKRYGKPRSVPA